MLYRKLIYRNKFMQTRNLKLDLIEPSQLNKEVFFNEHLCILDSMISNNIRALVSEVPRDEYKNEKFIITDGENKNKICYAPHIGKNWRFLDPIAGMAFFCLDIRNFIYFDGESWVPMASSAAFIEAREDISFKGAIGDFLVTNSVTYVYLSGHAKIILRNNKNAILHLIVKQNYSSVFNIQFDAPILWKEKVAYVSSRVANKMDYIRLIKLPETEHYLGEIVYSGYTY